MYNVILKRFSFFLVLLSLTSTAQAGITEHTFSRGSHRVTIGPETYHIRRDVEGGSYQKGWLGGWHFNYERIKKASFYLGAEAHYVYGRLNGFTSSGKANRSKNRDQEIEARFGYTWARTIVTEDGNEVKIYVIPFIGGGYFHNTNRFISPSPLLVTFRDVYNFVSAGAITKVHFCENFMASLVLKGQLMANGERTFIIPSLSGRPTAGLGDRGHMIVEVPLDYIIKPGGVPKMVLNVTPFYRKREYTGQEAFPYNCPCTEFHIWGCSFSATAQF